MADKYTDYTASQGDTWSDIAYRYYGDGMAFTPIIRANRAYSDVLTFDGGELIHVPVQTAEPLMTVIEPWGSEGITYIASPWED